ncbi:HEAT repeat domain-containing protein [Blastopirellula sp. JC732]|uniref:HEAT repeat domain-containing protein n=1 Tax=Blastopirellula sediminis TaxID=2894196 RepID=A0A9X1MTI4_9BACT|nr:HEAT repeat domain-containing protein [Blastopirellula sediminis]MCC9604494.1 HEAT repeat domain-containing protein [Blastopirellula sediminis]MCC9632207.1 HEAT repeat domain-containing protein [Blastopirellula sediminis]
MNAKRLTQLLTCGLLLIAAGAAEAETANWIWAPQHSKDAVPRTSCFFRKTINVRGSQRVILQVAADDAYELWINGARVVSGHSWQQMRTIDVTRHIVAGRNVVGVQVTNTTGSTAGLAVRIEFTDQNGRIQDVVSDATWLASTRIIPQWQSLQYNDSQWSAVQVFGPQGSTAPWLADGAIPTPPPETPATTVSTPVQPQEEPRFQIMPGFAIQEVISADKTGSLIAMAFNEFGGIVASQEGGPLMLFTDENKDGVVDSARVYCDEVKNVQGILPLNGDVYVVGEGPQGTAMYHLKDEDQDGTLSIAETLIKFTGPLGEHGAHQMALGPDGLIYLTVGNHTQLAGKISETSPHRNYYEGDLVKRFEDPGGHAVGVKAPGGMILRTDVDGSFVEVVAGGLRNSYDLSFNRDGELFTYDSDMEWDEGLVWHLPPRVMQVIPGAEFGWRSGWAKWPSFYLDALPATLETKAASPTGMVFYDHQKFPTRFQDRLFACDWSNGRITTLQFITDRAGYRAQQETFLEGKQFNATDIDVGPDGWLYICTGGRGTDGGLYRIVWKGDEPAGQLKDDETGIAAAVRQPQPHSAWGRQHIAEIQQEMGSTWDAQVQGVAIAEKNPSQFRVRALELMQLYGPTPSIEFLLKLSNDPDADVRMKTMKLLSLRSEPEALDRITDMLSDASPKIRRAACEALAYKDTRVPLSLIQPILTSSDRREAWSARRLLERQPVDEWFSEILATKDAHLFNMGAVAAMIADPTHERAVAICNRASELLDSYLSDQDFKDTMRVIQVAIFRGEMQNSELGRLGEQIAREFPAGDHVMNRELIQTLAFLQEGSITDRYIAHLDSDIPNSERLFLAMQMTFIPTGWSREEKLKLIGHLERGLEIDGGEGLRGYVEMSTKQFVKHLDPEEKLLLLTVGDVWPNATLAALFELPEQRPAYIVETLCGVDKKLQGREGAVIERLQMGIVAILAESDDEQMMSYLREVYRDYPERRASVAMGLAQQPTGENFALLLDSLSILKGEFASAVLAKLRNAPATSTNPEHIRQLIILADQLQDEGGINAIRLLEKWTGEFPASNTAPMAERVVAWQDWFAENHPEMPAAKPLDVAKGNWNLDELLDYLTGDEFVGGNHANGKAVFKKAQCAACHRVGSLGEAVGPDLTEVARRFQKRQILESVLFPSHVISDQYAARKVLTMDGQIFVGLVTRTTEGDVILTGQDGQKRTILANEIDEIASSPTSVMPEGLLDQLTAEEIADLMTFLGAAPEAKIAGGKKTTR